MNYFSPLSAIISKSPIVSHNRQWGLSSETSNGDSTISVTYPITFSVFNVVVPALYSTSGHKQYEGGGGDGITKSDLKEFSFYHGSDIRNCKLYWFAIGK